MLVAIGTLRATVSRGRWFAVAHAVLTWLVVIATANHFWLDGLVASALLLFAMLAAAAARALRPALPMLGAVWRRDLAPPESSPINWVFR